MFKQFWEKSLIKRIYYGSCFIYGKFVQNCIVTRVVKGTPTMMLISTKGVVHRLLNGIPKWFNK